MSVARQFSPEELAYTAKPSDFVGWRDQSEIDVFRGDLGRASNSQQSIGQFFAAVGFREPPRSRIDQGQALHCGQVCLTLA